ncbi:serine/threonine protein kinase [Roseofilum sp. BLCC_M154]|uniref:Serine/threonine protein kinase n=1 Tax=Roseofilum acuticapitatum BLCC-M154 TaxID=3022444 RepID=A0ABT7APG2_9CYAN|nr:hypothetical protein [Roseofilum acuticapitatum]MDJ1168794.1 serine/threonine protein kinase [Roseofilum acuticapitatum BLCC-M154]
MSIPRNGGQIFTYQVYGLTLASNQSLPGLLACDNDMSVDIWVDLKDAPESDSAIGRVPFHPQGPANFDSQIEKRSRADGSSYFNFWYRGNEYMEPIDLQLEADGSRISSPNWTNSIIEDVTVLLLGSVLKLALRLQGKVCLHGCVLAVGEQAIAILGDSGAGKSTTAAALAGQGYPILSDDVALLTESSDHFLVHPGYPRLRLWPESVNALYGSEEGLARVLRLSEKRFIDLTYSSDEPVANQSPWQFQKEPLPLAAIYVLGERQPGLAAPVIESIPPAMAVVTLMKQRSATFLKLDTDKQAQEFVALSQVAKRVPLRNVTRRDSLDALPQLCDAITADAARITKSEKCTHE